MAQRDTVRLYVDASSDRPFSGSCSVVSHLWQQALSGVGYECRERLVRPPRLDAATGDVLPAERVDVTPAGGSWDLFFEEVFLRADFHGAEGRERSGVFFNLMCFDEQNVEAYAGVRALIFNSAFLQRVFLALVAQTPAAPRFSGTHFAACPLSLPELSFPGGYDSVGEDLPQKELEALKRLGPLGHALRPGLDPLAAVAIMAGLRDQQTAGGKARLAVLESHLPAFEEAASELGVPRVHELFVPLPRLKHTALLRLMRASDFGLAYDVSIEAFGFYALESVWCASPLFSNGSGNLRHLLPAGHGVVVHEHSDMHFGDANAVLRAYAVVSQRIADELRTRDERAACEHGRARIMVDYAPARFERAAIEALMRGQPNLPASEVGRFVQHPLCRLVDLPAGRVIGDEGAVQLSEADASCLEHVLAGQPPRDDGALARLHELHIVAPALANVAS